MGGVFGGGSAQSTSSVTSTIDFSPVFNIGDDNESAIDKKLEQTSSVTPKLDESMTASVGVGVAGGSGSGGAVMRSEDVPQPILRGSGKVFLEENKQLIYLAGAVAGGVILVKTLKNKKKK